MLNRPSCAPMGDRQEELKKRDVDHSKGAVRERQRKTESSNVKDLF